MSTQVYSSEMVENLATAFPRRNENSFAWGNAISYYLGLPQLRSFWPTSSVNESGNLYDLSEQNRILTNVGTATFGVYGLQSYATGNGATQDFTRADEAGLDITGNLTFGAWVRVTAFSGASSAGISGKWTGAGNQRSYLLYVNTPATQQAICNVSVDGTAVTMVTSTSSMSANTWHFVAGRFTPSTELAIFLDNEKTTNIVAIPASIFNGTSSFNLLSIGGGSRLTGNISLAFLCAAACSDAQINALYWLTKPLFYGS